MAEGGLKYVLSARGKSRTFELAIFETAASAIWATRARAGCGRWESNPQPEGSIFKTDAFAVYATSAN